MLLNNSRSWLYLKLDSQCQRACSIRSSIVLAQSFYFGDAIALIGASVLLVNKAADHVKYSYISPAKSIIMFSLPSLWNLVISTIVFFIAAWYVRYFLDEQGFSNGKKRDILVFLCASLLSWGAGEAVDWSQEKLEGKKLIEKNSGDLRMINQIPQ